MANKSVIQKVADAILELMDNGVSPWQKDWINDPSATPWGIPANISSGNAYRGVNVPMLWHAKHTNGFDTDLWVTYKQAQDMGGHVTQGEKSTAFVCKFKKITVKDRADRDKTVNIPMWKTFAVFNVEQTTGIDYTRPEKKPVPESQVLSFASSTGASIEHVGNRACYIPSADKIQLPHPEQFRSQAGYNGTLLHELVHWTGDKTRCDRQFGKRFGDQAYAFEELVAESGSAFVCATLGLPYLIENHASYLTHWRDIITRTPQAIMTAFSQAQKATDYIIDAAEVKQEAA